MGEGVGMGAVAGQPGEKVMVIMGQKKGVKRQAIVKKKIGLDGKNSPVYINIFQVYINVLACMTLLRFNTGFMACSIFF
jgi:hypothetical protein